MEVGLYRLTEAHPSFNFSESVFLRDFRAVASSLTMSDRKTGKVGKKNRVVARELPYGMCVHSHMLLRHSKGNLAADSFAHLRIYVFQLLGLWCNVRICNIVKPKLK